MDHGGTSRSDYLGLVEELTGVRHPVRHLPVGAVATACDAIALLRRRTGSHRLPDVSGEKIRTRAVEARHDTSRLRADTGWQPRWPLWEGLAGALGIALGGPQIRIERVGLIGDGDAIATVHLDALRRIEGASVTGILDIDASAARRTAARFGVAAHFTDAARFYEEARPQIVHVLTPPQSHAQVALEALRRGVHVLLEKPACFNVAECDTLREAADAARLTVGVDENFAHDPLAQEARGLIAAGAVGEIVHVSAFLGFDLRRSPHFHPARAGASWNLQLAGGELEGCCRTRSR